MELSDEYNEEVQDAAIGDDTTACEVEQVLQENPFLKCCGDVLKDVNNNAEHYNLKKCNFS